MIKIYLQKNVGAKNNRGFTLLMASLISSILLTISLFISNTAIMESSLFTSGKNSQIAFYAADSGAECALYWGIKRYAFNPLVTSDTGMVSGGVDNIVCNNRNIPINGNNSNNEFTLELPNNSCAIVKTSRSGGGTVPLRFTIESRGYNVCNPSSPGYSRRVERAVRVTY